MRIGLFLLGMLATTLSGASTPPWTGVDAELARHAADGSFAGAVSVSKGGLLLYSAARGDAINGRSPNTVDTKFRFGWSEAITQVSVMMSCFKPLASRICCACFASGVFVKSMSVVSAEPSNAPADAPAAMNTISQTITVRHGWRLLARAMLSGLSLTCDPLRIGALSRYW